MLLLCNVQNGQEQKLKRRDVGRERETACVEISHPIRESWNGVSIIQHKWRRDSFSLSEYWLINKS